MSEVKVNKISPRSGTDVALGDSGDTFTIPSGATLVNNGTATGFFEGIAWQSVVTASTLTTVAGRGYPINTTSNACTVTLPSSASTGDQIQIVDYAGTFATNNITLTSSLNIEGGTLNKILTTNREGVTITYVDATQGWVATSGVNSGDQALDPIQYSADFLVIAGGGGGGYDQGGGGGAGGYRASYNNETSGGGGSSETALNFNPGIVYTVTVGAGGTGINGVPNPAGEGSDSSISGSDITTITSIGGGRGGNYNTPSFPASTGGSGGGGQGGSPAGYAGAAGTANQGFAGGSATGSVSTGTGGGGAGAVGVNSSTGTPGAGGNGVASTITGSSVTRGGGGGSMTAVTPYGASSGGTGGGGDGSINTGANGNPGTANTGGGGGGIWNPPSPYISGSGGSGVVILRVPTTRYSGTTTGSPTVTTDGTDTIMTFNSSGSYTG